MFNEIRKEMKKGMKKQYCMQLVQLSWIVLFSYLIFMTPFSFCLSRDDFVPMVMKKSAESRVLSSVRSVLRS